MTTFRSRSRSGFTLIELMIVIAIIAILAAILVPNFLKARAQGQLTACKSNLKNMATALEMYASDFGGRYPASGATGWTAMTTGNYLKAIPTCPAAGTNTYSTQYTSSQTPDTFSFWCSGTNHSKAYSAYSTSSTNFPQYSAERGLVDHP